MISIVRKRLACAVNWLLMKSSRWRQADKESVILIKTWLHEAGSVTSITDLAELLGFSAAKMYSVMNLTGVPLTIAEFAMVCEHFGKDPTEQCMNIFTKCGYDLKPAHAHLLKEAVGGRRLSEHMQQALNAYRQDTSHQEEIPPPHDGTDEQKENRGSPERAGDEPPARRDHRDAADKAV